MNRRHPGYLVGEQVLVEAHAEPVVEEVEQEHDGVEHGQRRHDEGRR